MRYLMFVCADPEGEEYVPEEDNIQDWVEEMDGRKVRLLGNRLQGVEHATTVRHRKGKVLITDGPFAETKEWIAGFDLLECADLDEAVEIAAKHPMARFGRIEVRPCWTEQGGRSPGRLRDIAVNKQKTVAARGGTEKVITRINHFEAKPGLGAGLREFLKTVIALVRNSAGCRSCQLLEPLDHADRFAIVEVWDSVEAHQAAAKAIPPSKLQEAKALFATPATGAYFRPVEDAPRS